MLVEFESSIFRNGDDITVSVSAECSYDRGEFIERGHPWNGYGAGWDVSIKVFMDGVNVSDGLTDREYQSLKEESLERI